VMEQPVTDRFDSSVAPSERFRAGIDDVAILPTVAVALIVNKILWAVWIVLKNIIDFLFPILLQLMRIPLFTLRILGDGIASLLKGIARILPVGGLRRAAWREAISRHWAWLRAKISYRAFEEAVHHIFENGMAWVFRRCRTLTPGTALLVLLGAVLWLPISFGTATLMHAVLFAKAASLPAWMQLLHPFATIIAKSKLLVLPVYPAAWPQAKQHQSMQAIIRFWRYLTQLHVIRKMGYRYRELDGAVAMATQAVGRTAPAAGLMRISQRVLAALNTAAITMGNGLRNLAGAIVELLASVPVIGTIVRRYADHYDEANRHQDALLSERVHGFFSRWSLKFSADYYEAKEREAAAQSAAPAQVGRISGH
jgi:hypothetical protein